MLPTGIDRERFLREYWQRRPLLMRAAIPPTAFALAPDELAGLACEPEFESRLIVEHAPDSWSLRHGPFDEDDFAQLPETHWTLLVQDVDKFVPEVTALIDAFDFVPRWRVDDIMISYAADQGGVGPHTDAYDVFLMQAVGTRRWRLSYRDYTDADLIPGLEQRILARFETDDEWLLEPGDVLYLPPGVAHWGIAEGECMTYSLGFRSPSRQEIAGDWFQFLVAAADRRHLEDPNDLRTDSLAELTVGAGEGAAAMIRALPDTRSEAFRLWFGRFISEPKPQFQIPPPDETWEAADLAGHLAGGEPLSRHPWARLAWCALDGGRVALFFQGEERVMTHGYGEAVRYIAEHRRLAADRLAGLAADAGVAGLLLELVNLGVLETEPPA